ncbi:c-type cytochrome [Dendrosporobacter sp. 1207_IL3150]|uniref:c-type cytochrome n=1 Tax=Dendrosporobacter sp. 1207_IL3150 TaxID=3084054 RepID=UPI002FD9CE1D
MNFGLKGFLLCMLGSLLIFAGLVYHSISFVTDSKPSSQAAEGKKIFQRKACIECHTIFGNGGYNGGDITHIYEKYGTEALNSFFTNPPLLGGAKYARHMQLTRQESEYMSAYLKFLHSINTLDWPPEPAYNNAIR